MAADLPPPPPRLLTNSPKVANSVPAFRRRAYPIAAHFSEPDPAGVMQRLRPFCAPMVANTSCAEDLWRDKGGGRSLARPRGSRIVPAPHPTAYPKALSQTCASFFFPARRRVVPPPPRTPPDQSDHRGKNRNFQ